MCVKKESGPLAYAIVGRMSIRRYTWSTADVLHHFYKILFPYSGKIPLLARFLLLWYDMVRLLNKFLKNVSFPNRIFPSVRMCILENYAQKSTWKPLVFAMGWG